MSLFIEPELSWQPWQPRRRRVLSWPVHRTVSSQELGCAFRFLFRFLPGLIFRNPFFLRNPRNSAEHTLELNHSRARSICSGIRRNPEFWPEFWREERTHDLCPPQYRTILPFFCNLPHHSMLPVVPGPPSPLFPPTAAVCRRQHPQPVDAETERRGMIKSIEFKVLMYTQLSVINNQCLRDFDTVV